jgi:hypothetical protein
MKKIYSIIICLALVLTMGVNTAAAQVAVGADLNVAGVYNYNNGNVFNFTGTNADSGYNFTFMGASGTGTAGAAGVVANTTNSNDSTVLLGDGGTGPQAVNYKGFGPISWNPVAVAVDANVAGVINLNNANVFNFVNTSANSGHNFTMGGGSDTGNVAARSTVTNTANTNVSTVGVLDIESGPVATNWSGFGFPFFPSGGTQVAVSADLNVAGVYNFNQGNVMNAVMTDANSGDNVTLKFGSMGVLSNTGNAVAASTVTTTVNTNTSSVFVTDAGTGPLAVNNAFGTGTQVAVAADVNLGLSVNTNEANVDNFVLTTSNSGDNFTGDALFTNTGNATSRTTVANTVNTNTTIMVVEDSSTGLVAGNTQGMPGSTPCSITLPTCGGAGGTTAANVGTSGTAVAAGVTGAVAVNENNADVNNVTVTQANTGDNTTIGGGSNTGNASAATSVSNTVNTNTTTVVIMK